MGSYDNWKSRLPDEDAMSEQKPLVCDWCGEDAKEGDYAEVTDVTTCAHCRGDEEPSGEDVFERAMCAKYPAE